jgi:HK97 gp10 family phage protein
MVVPNQDKSLVDLSFKLEGMDELDAKLQELIASVKPEVVEPFLLEGARTIRDAAKANSPPPVTGNLRRSIKAKTLKQIGIGPRSALAGIDYRIAPHAHLLEYGTVKMAARPFFRKAWDANKTAVKEKIIDKLKAVIEAVARK